MGPGSDGPLGAMAGMEPHHMNGSLGNTAFYQRHRRVLAALKGCENIVSLSYGHSIQTFVLHIVSFLGSGDLDGMNKVNILTT